MNMPFAVSQENQNFSTFIEYLNQIYDPREQKKIKYPLCTIIFLAICGLLGGANNFVEIADYCKSRKPWLKKYFGITKIPSHDTFNRVFGLMLPMDFNHWVIKSISYLLFKESKVINIDGKVIV